jgi:hypothetical protein
MHDHSLFSRLSVSSPLAKGPARGGSFQTLHGEGRVAAVAPVGLGHPDPGSAPRHGGPEDAPDSRPVNPDPDHGTFPAEGGSVKAGCRERQPWIRVLAST